MYLWVDAVIDYSVLTAAAFCRYGYTKLDNWQALLLRKRLQHFLRDILVMFRPDQQLERSVYLHSDLGVWCHQEIARSVACSWCILLSHTCSLTYQVPLCLYVSLSPCRRQLQQWASPSHTWRSTKTKARMHSRLTGKRRMRATWRTAMCHNSPM